MSKVLVDRELLENCLDAAKDAYAATLLKDLQSILSQPAEAEGERGEALTPLRLAILQLNGWAKVAAEDGREHTAENYRRVIAALRTAEAQHRAALSAVTAERDRLRDAAGKAIAWLDAEQNESGVGINRRLKLCRDAENSLRAAMAAKEA